MAKLGDLTANLEKNCFITRSRSGIKMVVNPEQNWRLKLDKTSG